MGKKRKGESRPENLDARLIDTLNRAYEVADDYFITKEESIPPFATSNLSEEFIGSLEDMAA